MIYIVNDLHGAKALINATVAAIHQMECGDILIINGDGAGARGPIMNNLVKIYYEVRRGETEVSVLLDAVKEIIGEEPDFPKDWIFDTVHGGLFRALLAQRYPKFSKLMSEELTSVLNDTLEPLSKAAKIVGVKLIYLSGNGEITPKDFDTSCFTKESAVDPEDRFYQQLYKEGFFDKYSVEYVPYVAKVGDAILVSTNLLDMDVMAASALLERVAGNDLFKVVIAHYPPAISPIGGAFSFWTPNKMDIKRSDALKTIISRIGLDKNAQFFFGHIHLGVSDSMANYPSSMGFCAAGYYCTWVKPGTVIALKDSQ